jgi:hypothetical protein
MRRILILSTAALALTGCETTNSIGGGGGPPSGTLPVTASGKMIAVRLPSTVSTETNTYTNLPWHSANPTSATATDRTAAGGVGISGSADADPAPNQNQGGGPALAALITAQADGDLAGGAAIIGMNQAKGAVYFEGGNFGDPQVETANAAISTVGVYNISQTEQIVLKDATTIRYRDGNDGDTEANYGVGYIGNPTANMPGSGTATYKGFYEQGIGVYSNANGVRQLWLRGDAQLVADFNAGTVSGGVSNGELGTSNSDGSNPYNPNAAVTGMAINASIAGSEYTGTARLVDAGGNDVGTVTNSEVIGGFFGANAAETIAASSIEGSMTLDGLASDYVMQGVIGGVKTP